MNMKSLEKGREMIDLTNGKIRNDSEVVFYDGFLYIISTPFISEDGYPHKYSVVVETLSAEYDDPLSLADIQKKYPYVCKVIYESALEGYVYNYGNHPKDKEKWELVGTTLGYA